MKLLSLIAFLLMGCSFVLPVAGDIAPVLHYNFEGDTKDQAPGGYHGKLMGDAKIADGALQLDGQDDYLTAGKTPGNKIDLSHGGTLMIWAKPIGKRHGGLVAWCVDHTYPGARCMITIDTYHGGEMTKGLFADGKQAQGFLGFQPLPLDQWTHVAVTFDGKTITTYWNGVVTSRHSQQRTPVISDVELTVGRALGLGHPYFKGALDEVRVYDRPLTRKTIKDIYLLDAAQRGKDVSVFHQPHVVAHAYPAAGKITVALDSLAMLPLPQGAAIHVQMGDIKKQVPVTGNDEVIIDASNLKKTAHDIRVFIQDANGKRIGNVSTVKVNWPGRPEAYQGIKILNNFCWELINTKNAVDKVTFRLPVDRWIWVRSQAGPGAAVSLGNDTIIEHKTAGTLEGMRRLTAGEHTLRINSKIDQLTVRAIPTLQHAMYGADPWLPGLGKYDWAFLERNNLLNNFNVMVAGLDYYSRGDGKERIKQWHAMGKQWLGYKALPFKATSADEVYSLWTDKEGFLNPLASGIIIDEANGGDLKVYDYLTQAVKRMEKDPQFNGKAVYPWCDVLYMKDRSTTFAQACLDGGGDLVWERYFAEEASVERLRRIMRLEMSDDMPMWEETFPGITSRMIIAFNNCSEPPENSAYRPDVDFKVCMEEQMHYLANHPAMFGIGGTQWYHSGYSSEDVIRWIGLLNRHYAIEGNTKRLSKDPYILPHLRNHDFVDGPTGWELIPADGKSMRFDSMEDYGEKVQSRFMGGLVGTEGRPYGVGDTYLLTTRRADKPNTIKQTITDLSPGRVYSFKVLTADHQHLLKGITSKDPHAISIKIDGVEMIEGDQFNFQGVLPQTRPFRDFAGRKRFYIGYHRRTFRATAKTAQLTVTDWSSESKPGGAAGQELMFSFFEVQPFLMVGESQ